LKINIQNIPAEGLLVDLAACKVVLESPDIVLEGPIAGKLWMQRAGGPDVHVRGSLSASAWLSCGRCLTRFISVIESEFYVDCTHEEKTPVAAGQQEHRLYGEELNLHFYQGEILDISEVVADQIYLEAPMAPLCREDCEGLCLVCGGPFQSGVCGCVKTKSK
jgi:uncharacterized protein